VAPSPATVSCDLTGEQRESLTQNVMLTRGPNGDRVAMLGDFGLSKRLEDTLDMAKTCIGSPFYMVRASLMLGDFGLSKRLEDTLDMAKTCIGTPFYMVRASRRGGGRGSSGGNSSSVGRTNLYAWSSPRRCLCLGWLTTWRRRRLWGGGLGVPLSNRAPHVSPHRRLRCCGHPTRLAVGVSGSRTAPNRRSQRTVQRSTIGIELEGHQLVASGVV
jgi:hypothetical protein